MNGLMKQVRALRKLANELREKITELVSFGCESTEAFEVSVFERIVSSMEAGPMNISVMWASEVQKTAEALKKNLFHLEKCFLVSESVRCDVQWRLALLDFNTDEAMAAYRTWNDSRDWSTPIAELREKFVAMMDVLVEAERLSAEARIAKTFSPEPPKRKYPKNQRFDRGPAKGRSQKVDDRGFGTSKKSRLKQRQHRGHSELAKAG